MKSAVALWPARPLTPLEDHQPVTRYDPGDTEKRYLAPERTVSEATRLGHG
jgi:hypothetical protein